MHLHRNQLTKVMKQQLINNSPKVSKATFYQNLILYSKYYIKKWVSQKSIFTNWAVGS